MKYRERKCKIFQITFNAYDDLPPNGIEIYKKSHLEIATKSFTTDIWQFIKKRRQSYSGNTKKI